MKIQNIFHIPFTLLTFAGLLSALTAGCSQNEAKAVQTVPAPPAVTVETPLTRQVTRFADFTGSTEALESVAVRARVEGVLEKIYFTEGDLVSQGDLLYAIDDKPYQIRLAEAEAQLAVRNGELQLAEARSRRRGEALKDKAVSEVAVIEANADLITARANVAAAGAVVENAKLDLSYTRIKAPISGRIARTLVDPGNLVGSGERTLLTTILRDDSIYAYFTMNERDLLRYRPAGGQRRVTKGTRAFLGLADQDEYTFEGEIDYIHNQVDAATGTIRIRAVFPNPDHHLLPGLFARIRLSLGETPNALLVPESALSQDLSGTYLLVVDARNKVRRRPVTLGQRVNDLRVIVNGIDSEDRIIVNGLQRAVPGRDVTPMAPAAAAKNSNPARTPSA